MGAFPRQRLRNTSTVILPGALWVRRYRSDFGRSMSQGTYECIHRPLGPICTEICREKWALASRLSRSLNVIGTDTDRSATYDFLLVIHSNHGLISYRFPDKRRFRSKISINFPTQCVDNVPVDRVPLECCNGSGAQNARMVENI